MPASQPADRPAAYSDLYQQALADGEDPQSAAADIDTLIIADTATALLRQRLGPNARITRRMILEFVRENQP